MWVRHPTPNILSGGGGEGGLGQKMEFLNIISNVCLELEPLVKGMFHIPSVFSLHLLPVKQDFFNLLNNYLKHVSAS